MWEFIKDCIEKNSSSILFDNDRQISHRELIEIVSLKGDILRKLLPPKSKCAVLCEKGLNAAIAILSCWYADLVPIPMSKNYGINHCANIVCLTNPDVIIYDRCIDMPFTGMQFNIDTHDIIESQIISTPEESLKDVAVIMCTSGTTGTPKGVMITQYGLIKNVENIAAYFDIKKDDTIIIARPLYHCAVLTGEFLLSLFIGLDICFFDEPYNPVSLISCVNKYNVSVLCGTPTLLNHISRCLGRSIYKSTIKAIAISGECSSKKIAENIRNAFPKADIYYVYGLTESAPRVTYLPPKYFDEFYDSVGIPLQETCVKIVDMTNWNHELKDNMHGKVMIKSPSIMKGYYNNEELSKSMFFDGWLFTGDIGYKDDRGFIYILSRADDMIIKAGMNIYPKEIEDIVNEIDVIESCIAYGVRDEDGQHIAIDIVLNTMYDNISMKEIIKTLANILPPYKVPSKINIVESIKKNASGKIVRRRMTK